MKIAVGKPKKKYRIYVRQLKTSNNKKERMRGFTIYDYSGNTTVDSISEKLQRIK